LETGVAFWSIANVKTCFLSITVVIISDVSLATFSYLKNSSDDVTYLEGLGWLPLLFVICIIAAQATGVYPSIQVSILHDFTKRNLDLQRGVLVGFFL
jgi:hypothetical protein